MNCPLCNNIYTERLAKTEKGQYYLCGNCMLAYLPAEFHLSEAEEHERYKLHNNDPNDANYVSFLTPLVERLDSHLTPDSVGLDFGCGPTTATSQLMAKRGHHMSHYDKYFFPETTHLKPHSFDFITASEVIEHLREPKKDFAKLNLWLKPGGFIGFRTEVFLGPMYFEKWHYHRDPTHICFYHKDTFNWIAKNWNWTLLEISPEDLPKVVLFQKN